MVNINQIPEEKQRLDLADLPQTNTLKLVNEEIREATTRDGQPKTGGLIITFEDKDGNQFPQKYSKVSGKALKEALQKLGYKTTAPLKEWHNYKMVPQRVGYPRYMPTGKA